MEIIFGNQGNINMSGSCWDAVEIDGNTNDLFIRSVIPFSQTTKKDFIKKNKIENVKKVNDGIWKGYYLGIKNN